MPKELPAKPVVEIPKNCPDCNRELAQADLDEDRCPDCKFSVWSYYMQKRLDAREEYDAECARITKENAEEAERAKKPKAPVRRGIFR